MKYLLDSDHLSILQKESGDEYERLVARLDAQPTGDVAMSIVSFHEQVLGCHTYITRARNAAGVIRGYRMLGGIIEDFTSGPVLLFESTAAQTFADLTAQRIRIATMDLRIAAIALSRRVVLLTRNTVDFDRVPGLQIEDWTR